MLSLPEGQIVYFKSRNMFAKSLEAYSEIMQYKELTREGDGLFEDMIAVVTALNMAFLAVQMFKSNH